VLDTTAALIAIHPIHVCSEPIARHQSHTFLQLLHHCIHLMAWLHALYNGTSLLADCRGEGEVIAVHVKSLRVGERLVAVDGVPSTWAELVGRGLRLWLAPLVALPIWMSCIVSCARMVRHLLYFLVALIHIELVTAAQTVEALSIAIPIVVLAFLRPGHAHQVEIQVTPTAGSISLEINVNRKRLPREGWVVEVVSIAVICGELVHEVESVRWPIFHRESILQSCCAWKIVCVVDAIFIDDDLSLLSISRLPLWMKIRLAVLNE